MRDLHYLKKIRNRIEHYKVNFEIEEAEDYIGRGMRFLEKFLLEELEIKLKQKLDAETYQALSTALYTYEQRLKKAITEASEKVPSDKDGTDYEWVECPHCNEETLPIPPTTKGTIQCHFCGNDIDFDHCNHCGTTMLEPYENEEDGRSGMCGDCEEYLMSRD